MDNYEAAMNGFIEAHASLKSSRARLRELDELMAQGKFAEADQLMAELDAELAELKAK